MEILRNKAIVFDLEATCEDRSINRNFDNETIEIGAVKLLEGNIIDEYNTFIKPVRNTILTDYCTELTSITQEDVDYARGYIEVIEEFKEWAEGLTLYSWGGYDKRQLKKDSDYFNLDTEWLENHVDLKNVYMKRRGLEKYRIGMKKALIKEGFVLEGSHHRGIDDARNISKLYKLLLEEI